MKITNLITSKTARSQFVQRPRSWLFRTGIAAMIAGLAVLAGASASAAVSLVGLTSGNFASSTGAYTNSGIDLDDTANVLVVAAYIDTTTQTYTNATFGGVAADGFINTGTGNREGVFYWLNPNTAAGQNLVLTSSGVNTMAYVMLQLSGVDTNAAVVTTGSTALSANTASLTTTANNSYVMSFYSINASATPPAVLTPTAPMTLVTNQTVGGGGGWLAAGANKLSLAGTEMITWSSSAGTPNQGLVGLAFTPYVPPGSPSVAAQVNPNSGQVGQSFTVTANVTPGAGSLTSVTVDLSAIGGSSAAPLILQGGNVYTNTFTVSGNAMAGAAELKVTAANDVPLSGSDIALFTVLATDRTWNGGSSGGNHWSDGANWVGNTAPAPGVNNNITFAGTTRPTPDMDSDYGATGVTFSGTAGAFVLGSSGGHVLTLGGDITDNSSTMQTLNLSITNIGNTIHINGNNAMTISGGIAGAGGLGDNASGTLVLTGTNTFTGGITINSGVLQIAGAGLLGGTNGVYAGNITNNTELRYSSSATQTLSGVVTSYGVVTKDGPGVLILAGNNTYFADTQISNGVLQVTGTLGNDVGNEYFYNIVDRGTLRWSSSAAQKISGDISGNGGLIKDGSGTLTLNYATTYSGPTVVNGGTLAFSPATVAYSSVNSLTINGGGTVLVNGGGTLPVSNLTLNTNAILKLSYDFSGGNPSVPAVAVSGALSTPGTNVIRISGFGAANTPFPLISYTGAPLANLDHYILSLPPGVTGNLVNNTANKTIDLNVTGSSPSTWIPLINNDGFGASSFTTNGVNWQGGNPPTNGNGYYTGPYVLRTPADTNSYTFAGSALSVSQYGLDATTGRFLLKGTGAATITVTNLILDGGLVDYADGAGNVTRTLAGNILLNSGTLSYMGALGGEAMFVTAPVTGSGSLQIGGANVNAGTDTAVVALQGANTYTGSTTVSTGTLLVNGSAPNTTVTVLANATLGGTGSISGAVTVQSGGTLSPGIQAYGALSNAIGTLTLNGAVSVSGTVSFKIDRDASPNSDKLTATSLTLNPGAVLTVNNIGSNNLAGGDTFTLFSAPVPGSFSVTNLPALPSTNLVWVNNLAVNGTLAVTNLSAGPTGPAQLTNSVTGSTLSLSWPASQGWRLQMQTNSLSVGLSTNWVYITDGSVSSTNITVNPSKPAVFYRLIYP